jgi:hypothetical protein
MEPRSEARISSLAWDAVRDARMPGQNLVAAFVGDQHFVQNIPKRSTQQARHSVDLGE